jgi:hypothetical protein
VDQISPRFFFKTASTVVASSLMDSLLRVMEWALPGKAALWNRSAA